MRLLNLADHDTDLATVFWWIIVLMWAFVTIRNWGAGDFELADFPGGLAAVLASIPISKALAIGLRRV